MKGTTLWTCNVEVLGLIPYISDFVFALSALVFHEEVRCAWFSNGKKCFLNVKLLCFPCNLRKTKYCENLTYIICGWMKNLFMTCIFFWICIHLLPLMKRIIIMYWIWNLGQVWALSWNDKPLNVNKFTVNNPVIYKALHVLALRGHLQRLNSKRNLIYNF
jgi:hypothetical protein